ncbi:NUDIX domain-containing protein [Halalkalibacter akibai]|uniref:ADP-ribose pyrophosphatase n=1 Tax=Halalkalibacter akibai (strain ATCC 43226 / DSM 21942 / CIP 109018 / JCM 9157 / 1139) TaxID=1236973 RepID=W4QXN7_HALA3|nr:NUDIX hydrolase [Halalkalibacter akibai]GAE36856.1 ADP-ribose pyrophosphatase [Halalkalibacter akibai JCM 9157]
MDHLYEKTTKTKDIYKGKIIDLHLEEVELPNGKMSSREVVKHPGAVAIIPITETGELVLVRQYRKALDKVIIEIPAGKLEPGEDPLESAKRELEEETGYKSEKLDFIVSFYTSPGFANELIYMYVTDTLIKGVSHTDEDEFLDVLEVSLDEALEMVKDQRIHDAKTAYAIQYLQLRELGKA